MPRPEKKRSSAAEAARRRAQEHTSEFARTSLDLPSGANVFSIRKAGAFRVDILPYKVGKGNPYADEGALHYERTFWVHRNIGVDQDTYVCPAKTAKKRCPICEYRAKLEKSPTADEDTIKALAPKERQLFNVVDLSAPDRGVQLWDISYHLFGKLLDSRIKNADDDEDFAQFCELEGGLTLKLTAEEKSMGQKFYDVTSIDFKARRQDYTEEWLESCYCLDDVLKVLEYDALRKIFLQTADTEEAGEEDDDAPPARTPARKAPAKKQAKPEPEEEPEDDDEVPFEEEDEEEAPPKKKPVTRPGKPTRKPEPEPEEDEPEEEAEEDEPTIEKGMQVTFRLAGKDTQGEVVSIPPGSTKVLVETESGKKFNVERSRLTVVEEEEEEAPPPRKKTGGKPAATTGKKKCPAGGVFGKSTDELEECEDCELWDECDNAKYPKK